MKRRNQLSAICLTAGIASVGIPSAWAQTSHSGHSAHSGMTMPASSPTQQDPAVRDHTAAPGGHHTSPASTSSIAATSKTDATPADARQAPKAAAMDHGAMQMQGGSAPPDARDPHAYSGGYALGVGKYALDKQRQLRMADEQSFGSVLVDQLERVDANEGNSTGYDMQAWFGRDYDRLVLKAEGDIANGELEDARTELLWGHAVASYWDTQLGVRQDSGSGPDRTWLAFGMQGLAPYWFEVGATAYVGSVVL